MAESYVHPAALSAEALLAECALTFTRRSGPGGQHRNKVATAVVLLHRPTGITAEANERRSQAENRQVAIDRLRRKLALEIRRPADAAPSQLWQSRCRNGRLSIAARHADFPTLLAEALDLLAGCGMDVPSAAQHLRCTPSQLVKFLKIEPQALAQVNRKRQDLGLRPYV